MAAIRLVLCAFLLAGCFTEGLFEAAKPVERYAPRWSRDIEVESAVRTPAGLLDLCVSVRAGDAAPTWHTVETDRPTPGNNMRLVRKVNGRTVLVESSFRVVDGCALTGAPLAIVRAAENETLELPEGADEAIYAYDGASGWALGYVSRQPLFADLHGVDFDLSHTPLFVAYLNRKPQLLLLLLPVTLALDTPFFAAATAAGIPWIIWLVIDSHRSPAPSAPARIFAPPDSKLVEVESGAAASDGRLLLCVVVRGSDPAPRHQMVAVERPAPDRGGRVEASDAKVSDGCALSGESLPVLHVVDPKWLALPPGAREALYSAVGDSGWSLGYLSATQQVEFDLSRSGLFEVGR